MLKLNRKINKIIKFRDFSTIPSHASVGNKDNYYIFPYKSCIVSRFHVKNT